METKKNIIQIMILILVVTFIGLLGLSMPIVALVYPIVLTLIGLKNGIDKSIITLITSLVFIATINQSLSVLIIPVQYGILAVATVYMINKKYKINEIIAYTIGLVLVMVFIHMALNWYFKDINTLIQLENNLIEVSEQQMEALNTQNISEAEKSQTRNILKTALKYLTSVLPVLLIMSSTFMAYTNYYISSRLARRSGRLDIEIPKFSKIIFPKHVILGLGTILLISYGLKYSGNINHMQLTNNIFLLIYAVFLVEGLSLIVHLINKMKINKYFKILFIVVIALSSFLNIILFTMGMLDIVLDFRKLREISEV